MVDTEVESVLREIREQVRAEQAQQQAASSSRATNGANAAAAELGSHDKASDAAEALARLDGYLTTTGRAWDRLPPVVSNRSGSLARLELWIKRRLKVATRWYAWEQVNFNAAVHHALRDMTEAMSSFEQRLQQIHGELQALSESQRAINESHRAQIEAQRAEGESQTRIAQALNARLTEELRSRDERLLDEQRVCLKQLSLEISEASTLFDRARRQIEARLDNLEEVNSKS